MVTVLLLTAGFMVAEFIGGYLANSLALMADAGHMASDVTALVLALLAMWMAAHPHTERRTFGFHRAEILAALANGAMLIIIATLISWHALQRLRESQTIETTPMVIIAVFGLLVNLVAIRILGKHRHGNLNVRGVFLHVLGDTFGSASVIFSAVVIRFTGWSTIDAVMSLFITVLIVIAGWRLVRETVSILLESSPRHVDCEKLRHELIELPGVLDVHDLHVWTVTTGFVALSCHTEITSSELADDVLRRATVLLRERYNIRHVTIQPETSQIHDELEHCCLDEHDVAPPLMHFLRLG